MIKCIDRRREQKEKGSYKKLWGDQWKSQAFENEMRELSDGKDQSYT